MTKSEMRAQRVTDRWVFCAAALLFAAVLCAGGCWEPAFAADGDNYGGAGYWTSQPGDQANPKPPGKILLCDSKTTIGLCASGLGIVSPPGYRGGQVNFEIAKDAGCSSCTIEIKIGSGTDEKHLVDTLVCGGHTSGTLPRGIGVAGRVYGEVMAQVGCTDLDVVTHYGME